ncbi:hypothetical protein BYT27DRAFT_7221740 [Phlegmacium glaucopus]|nr:hypothetical protein BYT27DRAFT_7221740 [Phlegmacium glaucopus]
MTGCRFLEKRLLFVPEGHPVTTATLAATLHQIAALGKIPLEAVQAIRAAAFLLDELDEGAIAATAREAVNDQLTYMNDELRTMTGHFCAMLEGEMEKHMAVVATATKGLAGTLSTRTFRDALLSNNAVPVNADPWILAREGIKARQFLVDFPIESGMRELSQIDVTRKFNEAIIEAGGSATIHKVRTVERLANKGLLGEFMTEEGANWFAQSNHFDDFVAALGTLGQGAAVKKRNHPVIAYYAPLHLNTNNPAHVAEIVEVNGLQEEDLLKLRWAKPPIRRNAKQTCGHLILTFASPDAANRAIAGGLVICSKRVSVAKYKKEPIRCLKCQGWNHVASDCVKTTDTCGTCGKGHRTSECTVSSAHHCISCSVNNHPSWARNCPTFLRKCKEFNLKHPENGLPFYPSQEPWTWALEPPRQEKWVALSVYANSSYDLKGYRAQWNSLTAVMEALKLRVPQSNCNRIGPYPRNRS